MRYTIVFGVLAGVFLLYAILLEGWAWLLLWPAVSFALVAFAYALNSYAMLGKRPSGTIALWAVILYLPFFLFTWTAWHTWRRRSRAVACHEVVPGLWLSRRPLPHEVPPTVTHIVDLTCEFVALKRVRHKRIYRCIPMLDGMIPTAQRLHDEARSLAETQGVLLIHCAAGQGRTGLFAVAILLIRGLAPDVPTALQMLRAVRPVIRLNPAQRRCANELAALLAANQTKG
jgi:protein-tyrosine phosphatase